MGAKQAAIEVAHNTPQPNGAQAIAVNPRLRNAAKAGSARPNPNMSPVARATALGQNSPAIRAATTLEAVMASATPRPIASAPSEANAEG